MGKRMNKNSKPIGGGKRKYEQPRTIVVNIIKEDKLLTGSVTFDSENTQPNPTSSATNSTWSQDENGGTTNTGFGTDPTENF